MSFLFWVFLLLLCITGYGVFSYIRIKSLIKKSAVLVKAAIPYQQTGSSESPKALFVGDSTGVGVGALDSKDSLAGRFGAAHPLWSVENLSVSGRKTKDLIVPLQNLKNGSYAIVVVQVGGNDITYFSDKDTLRKDITTVLEEAKRIGNKVLLLTCGSVGDALLLPRPIAFLWENRTLTVRKIFMQVAKEANVTYVDLFQEKKSNPFFLEPYRYYSGDLFHPNSEGYSLWYEKLRLIL